MSRPLLGGVSGPAAEPRPHSGQVGRYLCGALPSPFGFYCVFCSFQAGLSLRTPWAWPATKQFKWAKLRSNLSDGSRSVTAYPHDLLVLVGFVSFGCFSFMQPRLALGSQLSV